jgi:hypothetical protein
MEATIPQAYLIIACYDHNRWKLLNVLERQAAHGVAEQLFPYEKAERLPFPEGVRLIRTFCSGVPARIPPGLVTNKPMEQMSEEEWKERDLQVGQILASLPRKIPSTEVTGPGTEVDEAGVGWIAVVDAGYLSSFVAKMGGETGPLWNMYDIEIIPLNDDQTTADIYELMTPVNWNH